MSEKLILSFGYLARSGKDLSANYLVQKYNFERIAFADSLKEGCRSIFGLTDEQLYGKEKEVVDTFWGKSPREILQEVGTDCLRNHFDKDIWIKAAHKKIQSSQSKKFVISDLRFVNEAEALKQWGAYLIRLDRAVAGAKGSMSSHESENSLSNYDKWDYTIQNNFSIEWLYDKLDKIVQPLLESKGLL